MISRRNFLKIAGLSTVALGAGFTAGKLTGKSNSTYFAVHGFVPADEKVINNLIVAFRSKIKSSSVAFINSESGIGKVVRNLDLQATNKNLPGNGKITYTIKKINDNLNSDIIVSDGNSSIYSLNDFNVSLVSVRDKVKDKKAEYLFTAEYYEVDILSSLLGGSRKELVIENQNGVADRIPLNKNYKNILVNGHQGKTGIKIENGIAKVHKSTCRHEICKHSIASGVGDIIACAPNKVLIKIEIV